MSHVQNDIFLEQQREKFDVALSTGQFADARAVVDYLYSLGFTTEAQTLKNEMVNVPLRKLN